MELERGAALRARSEDGGLQHWPRVPATRLLLHLEEYRLRAGLGPHAHGPVVAARGEVAAVRAEVHRGDGVGVPVHEPRPRRLGVGLGHRDVDEPSSHRAREAGVRCSESGARCTRLCRPWCWPAPSATRGTWRCTSARPATACARLGCERQRSQSADWQRTCGPAAAARDGPGEAEGAQRSVGACAQKLSNTRACERANALPVTILPSTA